MMQEQPLIQEGFTDRGYFTNTGKGGAILVLAFVLEGHVKGQYEQLHRHRVVATDKPVFRLTRVCVVLFKPITGMLEDSPARDTLSNC